MNPKVNVIGRVRKRLSLGHHSYLTYPNENVFTEIAAPSRVVVRHDGAPVYQLTIDLVATRPGTRVT